MTCKNCVHYDVCLLGACIKGITGTCLNFKDKSRFIELPCKVGDTVYRITKLYGGEKIIVEGEAFEFVITHEHSNKYKHHFYFWAKGEEFIHRHYSIWCDFTDFGKTVFLTREEAEKALERSKGNA